MITDHEHSTRVCSCIQMIMDTYVFVIIEMMVYPHDYDTVYMSIHKHTVFQVKMHMTK